MKHSAKTICSNFQDLTQRPGEGVYLYFACNVETFKGLISSNSNDILQAIRADDDQKKTI
jgi:hypothetical protein